MTGWPSTLAGLHQRFVAEEVASALRHQAANGLTGIGALTFHLRRRLEATGRLGDSAPEIAQILETLRATIAETGQRLEGRFVAAPAATLRIDLAEQVQRLAAGLAAAVPVVLDGVAVPGPQVAITPAELELALRCLVDNAFEAADDSIRTAPAMVRLRLLDEAGGFAAVAVEDEGAGVAAEAVAQAFEPFFTTKSGHLGLGLSIARRIAERWGGRVELGPCPAGGPGTCARLLLPAGARADR